MKKKTFNYVDVATVEENSNIAIVLPIVVNNLGDKRILDSRCSYHMSLNKDWFNTY